MSKRHINRSFEPSIPNGETRGFKASRIVYVKVADGSLHPDVVSLNPFSANDNLVPLEVSITRPRDVIAIERIAGTTAFYSEPM
jgi:hypothetical protein